jgi:hypothetical protein
MQTVMPPGRNRRSSKTTSQPVAGKKLRNYVLAALYTDTQASSAGRN